MLRELTGLSKIYIACGHTDLRKGIDGLAAIVKEHFQLDPFQKDVLFLFCGTRRDRFKGLIWEGDGFLLLYKRVEAGSFKWPRTKSEMSEISTEQFRSLLDGFVVIDESSIRTDLEPTKIL
jgi:transposase